jgi:cytochrome c peroxidase
MQNRRMLLSLMGFLAVLSATMLAPLLHPAQASPSGHAPYGTVTIDGITVPDIGPLPTSTPAPSTNLNYTDKIDSGKQLYFDGRRSKSGAIFCAFKTPTLRSIIETAPYMHDDTFKTLEEVVDFLNEGGGANQNLSTLVKPLNLTPEEKTDLMAFFKALTEEPVKFQMPKLPK